ncbi:MAG: flagellar basal body rod C-terminal domain-containing protein [Candidatus Sericytochromatia bacterium]
MVLLSGTAGSALASLTAIDQWISTLNSSIAGSARTGFKNAKVTFGGGTTRLERPVLNGALGIQYAEQALNVGSTNIDFSQGQVVASTEFTHMAISGSQNAFFLVADNAALGAGTRYYYTRDGEFHRDVNGNLVNANGLFLVSKNGGTNTATTLNGVTPEQDLSQRIDAHNLNLTGGNYIATAYVADLTSLRYSKYGSTVLEVAGNAAPAAANFIAASGNNLNVRITGSALEASNVQLPSTTVELSLAQKIYNALTKVIQVDQTKLDGILNLIR